MQGKAKGITARAFEDKEIVERTVFPLINEGFKILEEGMAQRPSDIDIVFAYGYYANICLFKYFQPYGVILNLCNPWHHFVMSCLII